MSKAKADGVPGMIVQCPTCRRKYQFDESRLAGRLEVKFRCPACGTVFGVKNPLLISQAPTAVHTPNPFRPASSEAGEATLLSTAQSRDLALPEDRRLALAVIRGEEVGRVYPIDRPRMTIGRRDADIVLSDLEVSRIHAAIEVYRDRVVLKDLGSTNGTYVDEKPIKMAYLQDRSEFRVGSTVLMLIVTPVEETTA